MSRLMYDSTKAADIPQGSQLVAGYVDGSCAWSAADFDRFPGRTVVRIAIFNDRFDAQVLDCEPGDNDAKGAVPWIKGKWDRGETPTVYCFTDHGPIGYDISEVRAACDAAGVKRPQFWIAQWDGNPGTFDPSGDPSIVAKQYANSAITGGHYDASIVADNWPGVDKETPKMTTPIYCGQSVTNVSVDVGKVVMCDAMYDYGAGPRAIPFKVYASRPGFWPVIFYPPVDPDADPTIDTAAQPALFVVAAK